jgi:glycogen debranching enzyme
VTDEKTADAVGLASDVLRTNRRRGFAEGFEYDFTCPSPDSYPFQWAWDSCFHAIALTHVDTVRARAELATLLRGIAANGFLPHMLLWQEYARVRAGDFRISLWDAWRSVTVAPPVIARAVERVHRATGDTEWLRRLLPDVCRFFEWLHRTRATGDGMLVIFQPDESGLDMSPKYDRALGIERGGPAGVAGRWHSAMRGLLKAYQPGRTPDSDLAGLGRFHWIDVAFNAIYADGLACLTRLLDAAGSFDDGRYRRRQLVVTSRLLRRCWDQRRGVFRDIDAVTGEPEDTLTISGLFPIIVDSIPDSVATRVIDEHLLNPEEFWLPYPLPSVAANEATFDPDFATRAIFRGSSWVNLNWYLYWGLRDRGRPGAASELARRTIAAVARSGLRECYGPYDAGGHGASSFAWSSLVLDLAAAEPAVAFDELTGHGIGPGVGSGRQEPT